MLKDDGGWGGEGDKSGADSGIYLEGALYWPGVWGPLSSTLFALREGQFYTMAYESISKPVHLF